VGTYCYVAVCRLGGARRFDAHRRRRGAGHIKGKGKASSLDIAPLTILNSGTFTTSEVAADWQ